MRIFLIIVLSVFYSCQGLSQSFEGRWRGEIHVQGMTLPLVFTFQDSGHWSGTLLSPSQMNTEISLSKVVVDDDSIYVEITGLQIAYGGRMHAEKEQIVGVFRQGGLQLDLVLERSDGQETALVQHRPQEPIPPYPYDTLEVRFKNHHDDVELAGTITQPKEGGEIPSGRIGDRFWASRPE